LWISSDKEEKDEQITGRDREQLNSRFKTDKKIPILEKPIKYSNLTDPAVIILDESIYPRKGIDPRRVDMPQDRMAKRLGLDQKTIHSHLGDLAALPNLLNDDLSRGFTRCPGG
jgi:hypothetical protein